jgi:DNA-binding beta-propeller fold protein YncE
MKTLVSSVVLMLALSTLLQVVTPQTARAQKQIIYAVLHDEGNLAIVDPSSGKLVQRIQVGRAPDCIVANADNSKLYISNTGEITVSIVSVTDAKVSQVLRLPVNRRNIYAGPMTRTPDGSTIFVAERSDGDDLLRVYAIDTKKEQIVGQFEAGPSISAVSVSNDGKKVFVANKGKGVKAYDAATYQEIGAVALLKGLEDNLASITCSPTAAKAYISYGPKNHVQVINTETLKSSADVAMPKYKTGSQGAITFSGDGRFAFVVNRKVDLKELDGVIVFDAAKDEVVKIFNSGIVQRGIIVAPDNKTCYVAADELRWYNLETLEHLRNINLRTPIFGIAVIVK